MAFILEKISEEDKQKYGFDSKSHLEYMWKSWAIDRERGVFLIKVGGVGMGVGRYELHYQNLGIVNFDAEERAIGNDGDAVFNVAYVSIPISLKMKIETIKSDIYNSLKKFGYFANPLDLSNNVEVNLPESSRISFKQGE